MKVYIKPNIEETRVDLQSLMSNSLNSVTDLDGVTKSDDEFDPSTQTVDSRRKDIWADEEEEEDQYKY